MSELIVALVFVVAVVVCPWLAVLVMRDMGVES